MPETPHHVSLKIDAILDRLNAQWDLGLPRLHGTDAKRAESELNLDARRCASRIRYLCYRSCVDMDSLIAEFDDSAKYVFSKWVFKPSQEKGTLQAMPKSKSFLKRDMVSKKSRHVTEDLRNALLQNLSRVLDEEYTLARESDTYERTHSQNVSTATSRSTSFVTAFTDASISPSPSKMSKSDVKAAGVSSVSKKRRKTSDETHAGQRTKPRYYSTTLDSFFQKPIHQAPNLTPKSITPQASRADLTKPDSDDQEETYFTSFETNVSCPTSVFSNAIGQSSASSNSTTRLSDDNHAFQDGLSTQAWEDMLADKSFSSLLDMNEPTHAFSIGHLNICSPFARMPSLPADVQFWLRWEIYRIASHINMAPQELLQEVEKKCGTIKPTYDQFWSAAKDISGKQDKTLPSKSDSRLWTEAKDLYATDDGRTASFSLKLDYAEKAGQDLWVATLNPINIDKGNRIHRKFGSDRHLVVSLNYFNKGSLPQWARDQRKFEPDAVFAAISKWLSLDEHHIAGRLWRAFYLEQEKTQNKLRRVKEGARQKLHLFATGSQDLHGANNIEPWSITELAEWHTPLRYNLDSSNLKLFSRWKLALSKTKSTVTLNPTQFRYLPDEEFVMNDGCALMSLSLARSIWDICGDGTNDIPTAFQGRICGAKGLWVLDYRDGNLHGDASSHWIEVSDSQLKIQPHPRDRYDADATQRTFEVLKYSTPCKPGHLNNQLINILSDRGVSRPILREIVLNGIKEYVEASEVATEDPKALRAWLEQYHKVDRNDASPSSENEYPDGKVEEMCLFVEGGFNVKNCEPLRDGMNSLMELKLGDYVEKLKIELPYSTSVFCVPDPYKCLEENEVYIGFSGSWENPKTGLKETVLDNVDVLVARNPAHLASDIQKRKAVYKYELRNFKDVIVFSTMGKIPLASLLSGGDYDGDTVTVIWDPIITGPFQCAEKPELPTEEQCGLEKASCKMRDIVKNVPPSLTDIDTFLESCILFNAQSSRLGMCTIQHETLIYNGRKLSDPGPIMLAALAGYLVDANKQGLSQSEKSWNSICKTTSGGRHLLGLAYKDGRDQPRRNHRNECINIMDYLKFDVAMGKKDEVLSEFNKIFASAPKYQGELSEPYKRELARAENKLDHESAEVKKVLDHLNQKIDEVNEEWNKSVSERANKAQGNDFAAAISGMRTKVQLIHPPKTDCYLYKEFDRDKLTGEGSALGCNTGARWSLLRASALYYRLRTKNRDLVWRLVGPELTRIKARQGGRTHEMTPEMHSIMKPDLKKVRRLCARAYGDADDEIDEL